MKLWDPAIVQGMYIFKQPGIGILELGFIFNLFFVLYFRRGSNTPSGWHVSVQWATASFWILVPYWWCNSREWLSVVCSWLPRNSNHKEVLENRTGGDREASWVQRWGRRVPWLCLGSCSCQKGLLGADTWTGTACTMFSCAQYFISRFIINLNKIPPRTLAMPILSMSLRWKVLIMHQKTGFSLQKRCLFQSCIRHQESLKPSLYENPSHK